jgi:hypothetical protein
MASVRQILANRRNSLLSSGPSEAGLRVSSLNARTHTLTAEFGFEDDQELHEQKLAELKPSLRFEGPLQTIHARRYVSAMLRVERCEKEEAAWLYRKAQRAAAAETWRSDREAEANALGEQIGRHPARVQRQLCQSLHGVEWLLAMWRGLARALVGPDGDAPTRPLNEKNRDLAACLMGLRPEELQGQHPLDPPRPKGPDSQPGDAEIAAFQAALVARETAQLEKYGLEELVDRDEEDRVATAMGVGVGVDRTTRLIRRYLATAKFEMDRHMMDLLTLQAAANRAAWIDTIKAKQQREAAQAPPLPDGSEDLGPKQVKMLKVMSAANVPAPAPSPAKPAASPAAAKPAGRRGKLARWFFPPRTETAPAAKAAANPAARQGPHAPRAADRGSPRPK